MDNTTGTDDDPPLRYVTLLVVMILTDITILFGNGLAIWAVYKNPILQTPTNFIFASLAATDLLSGLVSIPLELYNRRVGASCSFLFTTVLSLLSYNLGLIAGLHFIAVTTDRYIAVTRPLRYSALITTQRVVTFIGLSWATAVGIIGILFCVFAAASVETTSIRCSGQHYTDHTQQSILYFVAVVVVLFCITLLALNLRILQIAIQQSRRIADVQILFGPRDGTPGKVKAVKTTLVIVGVFCICWLPSSFTHFLVVNLDLPKLAYMIILDASFVMISFSSAINPFVYCFRDRSFRSAFLERFWTLVTVCQGKLE
ncbi:adenosine receptor A2a-like [Lytechinus variegatus]|uniref:adenosine receptor A2a-like n=1 Tax=Lytechinus variegatus TaxID=7654 RepID=UPI001BB25E00|nr:adenosine receptor A2a-like [Lytechinus variegatus]